tara:strand:- start:1181 stop:1543 length:363 start_codon:yes stop_codon:yes gene_type:complete
MIFYKNINNYKINKINKINLNIDIFFSDILKNYINVDNLIHLIINLEHYKLKNIINYINYKWIKSNNILYIKYKKKKKEKENIKFNKNIDFKTFNNILIKFIDNDIATSIFVVNCILIYI